IFVSFFLYCYRHPRSLHSFPTRRSSDLDGWRLGRIGSVIPTEVDRAALDVEHLLGDLLFRFRQGLRHRGEEFGNRGIDRLGRKRSEEHTSELQSPCNLVCRLLLEKKKKK